MAVRGLMWTAVMFAVGALITWMLAGVLEQHAMARNDAATQEYVPSVVATKGPAARGRF